MISIFLILLSRLSRAITTKPDLFNTGNTIIGLGIYILFALFLGKQSRFLKWEPQSGKAVVKIMATSFIAPAILEELFFRVLLLPYPANNTSFKSFLIWSIISLFIFVVYHPLNALTLFPQGKEVFCNSIFLVLAAGLGIICTLAYWQTSSLWLSVLIHWLTIVFWLGFFGGLSKLNYVAGS